MKHAFSSVKKFFTHLLANVISTFVERWLRRHCRGYVIFRNDEQSNESEVICYNHLQDSQSCVLIDDSTGEIFIGRQKEDKYGNK